MVRFVCFLQAEAGIRDWSVTGVQTCALPISARGDRGVAQHGDGEGTSQADRSHEPFSLSLVLPIDLLGIRHVDRGALDNRPACQIGRASCRERVWSSGSAVTLKRRERAEVSG